MFKYRPQAGDTEIDVLNGKIQELEDKVKDLRKKNKALKEKVVYWVGQADR